MGRWTQEASYLYVGNVDLPDSIYPYYPLNFTGSLSAADIIKSKKNNNHSYNNHKLPLFTNTEILIGITFIC